MVVEILDKKKQAAPSGFQEPPETQDQYYGAPMMGGGPLAIGYYNTGTAAPGYGAPTPGYGQPGFGYVRREEEGRGRRGEARLVLIL